MDNYIREERERRHETPTLLASARQKRSIPIQATISDDRSQGSEFDRSGGLLVALQRPLTDKSQHFDRDDNLPIIDPENWKSMWPPSEPDRSSNDDVYADDELPVGNSSAQLNRALRLISGALNIRDGPTLTIETLRSYVSELRDKEQTPTLGFTRFQLVHRVLKRDEKSDARVYMYLDSPLWQGGATRSKEFLAGNLPLRNVSSYLSNNPDICCIVYRDYDVNCMMEDLPDEDWDTQIFPTHTEETIEPATKDLNIAITKFLDTHNFNTDSVTATKSIRLIAPYFAFYHVRRDTLNDFVATLEGRQQIQFQALLNYLIPRWENEHSLVNDMICKGRITQEYIKYLFKPGDIVVQGDGPEARGYLCQSWLEERKPQDIYPLKKSLGKIKEKNVFHMDAWYWTLGGEFSRETTNLSVEFDFDDFSEKNIGELSIRPLAYVNESTLKRLRNRGEWFWKCRVRHIVSYDDTSERRHSSDERYMIDMMMYCELHKSDLSMAKSAKASNRSHFNDEEMKQEDPPDQNFVYLAPLTVKAYNLKRKKWLDLDIDGLHEVTWNTEAFGSLVLRQKTKRLIQALISNQIEAEKSTDLISGKGNGLILLLHGGPGTGKTLTAESVAEIAQKPLYPVTCGDIGTKPEDVETYLESVLYLGKTWGCVVLLDEADVFLEQRSLEDLHRNALVSVFLRVLEYYDGIIILTSNRVGTFDEAFKSRIQLAVHYNSLTTLQRTTIWSNFIQRLRDLKEEGIDFDDLEKNIKQLAGREMNGREIRNVITTARQYARWERQQAAKPQDVSLDYSMMKEVIEMAGEFDQYIKNLNNGLTQDQLATEEGLR